MSEQQPSPAPTAAPAARSTAEEAPEQKPQDSSTASCTATTPHITCFACSRCEYPVCDSSDLLLRKVRQGASDYAFQYNLDGLLDLDDTAVPCYSAAEVVHTSVVVSEALMKVPLPPAAQVVALESIVQSRKFWVQQRRNMNARLHEHGVAPLSGVGGNTNNSNSGTEAPASSSALSTSNNNSNSVSVASSMETTSRVVGPSVVRRYGDSSESRIDLVCVKDSVLETGVQECTQDRSAAATTLIIGSSSPGNANSGTNPQEGGEEGSDNTTTANTAPTVIRDPSFAHVPADVLKAATAAAAKTQWSSPGNMSLREAYMEVNRTTLSSRAPWFQDYRCVGRVQCPDCHQALGFVFKIAEAKKVTATPVVSAVPAAAITPATVRKSVDAPPLLLPTQGMKRPAAMHDRDRDSNGIGDVAVSAGEASHERGEGTRGSAGVAVLDSSSGDSTTAAGDEPQAGASENRTAEVDGARLPHAKKTKNENDAQAAAAAITRRGFQEALQQHQQQRNPPNGSSDGTAGGIRASQLEGGNNSSSSDAGDGAPQSDGTESDTDAPQCFIGLELKRIVQRNWDLHAFQNRYSKSRQLSTFRELFPEAEELQSLYSRLLGLRTQTELYNSLLRRHKEQNDVQMALLSSNKERMHTYDEKIKTMQQIIEAQRAQIEMQTRQIRNQEELVQSHRRQFVTQQRQMDVEQLLLTQQSKTIESQKEQLRLLKTHFQAVKPEVLEELRLTASPPPFSAARPLPPDADADKGEARLATVTSALASMDNQLHREDSAEEDWADTEDEEEGSHTNDTTNNHSNGESNRGARIEQQSPLRGSVGYRSTPPAHLCGVSTSFPAPRLPKREAADAPPTTCLHGNNHKEGTERREHNSAFF